MHLEALRHTYLRRVIAPLLGAIGLEASDRLARWLGCGVFDLNPPSRRRAEARLALAFNDVNDARRRVIAEMHEHFGRFVIEAIFARRLLRGQSWRRFIDVPDEAAWKSLAAGGRGCLLATAYYGNPAIAAVALGQIFRPVHVLADRFDAPILRDWQREASAFPDVRLIDPRDAVRRLPEVLAGGDSILMICEGERQRGRGVPAEFLGRTIQAWPTLGRLARWFDAPIAVFTCRRERRPFSFTLRLHEVLRPTRDEADDLLVRETLHHLERAIREAPGQYLWSMATPLQAEGWQWRAAGNAPLTRTPADAAAPVGRSEALRS